MKKSISITIVLLLCISGTVFSQLNPMGSIYYQNQYMANPALAGITKGWELNAAYKAQWTGIKGAPNMQGLTAAYGSENYRTGLGLTVFNDKAGIVRTTSVKATYAYHLQLNNNATKIDFGLSAGILDENVDRPAVIGDPDDPSTANFNTRKLYLDADFGLAQRTNGLTLQGTLPNLKRLFKRDLLRNVADRMLFMAAVAYRFENEANQLEIEPKVAFRAVENYKDLIDAGINFGFSENRLMLSGMYHSSGSVTFGAGTTYKKQFTVLFQYTTNTTDLQRSSNGEAEIALRYNFR